MRRVFVPAVILLAACGGGPAGYMGTDVLEVRGLGAVRAEGVQQGAGGIFQKGSLTWSGRGDAGRIFQDYIDAMRGEGWSPVSSSQDPGKGHVAKLMKDTRALTLEVMPAGEGGVSVTVKVNGAGQ